MIETTVAPGCRVRAAGRAPFAQQDTSGANGRGVGYWTDGAVDPETGMLYVGSQTSPVVFKLEAPGAGSTDIRYVFVNAPAPQPLGLLALPDP